MVCTTGGKMLCSLVQYYSVLYTVQFHPTLFCKRERSTGNKT
jgi:hypothetical protein